MDAGSSWLLASNSAIPAQPSSSLMTPSSEIILTWSKVEIVVTVAVAVTALVIILTVLSVAAVTVVVIVRRKHNNGNADNCPKAISNMKNPVYQSKPKSACMQL